MLCIRFSAEPALPGSSHVFSETCKKKIGSYMPSGPQEAAGPHDWVVMGSYMQSGVFGVRQASRGLLPLCKSSASRQEELLPYTLYQNTEEQRKPLR